MVIKEEIKNHFQGLRVAIAHERRIINELNILLKHLQTVKMGGEKKMLSSQITSLKNSLEKTNQEISKIVGKISLARPLQPKPINQKTVEKPLTQQVYSTNINPPINTIPVSTKKLKKGRTRKLQKEFKFGKLEREIIGKINKKRKQVNKKKVVKISPYIKTASKIFSKKADSLSKKGMFKFLERDLIKYNSPLTLTSYISLILFTTLISFFIGIFLFIFFLFFNVGATFPFISLMQEEILIRMMQTVWLVPFVPIGTFFVIYLYPALERKSAEGKINQELPFATINMAAISGSMINPTEIFRIIIATKEYPALQKEFTKLLNEINIYGYNLVVALRNSAFNSPSLKLAELLNGLATTINTGGDLPGFFEKRSQSLLFEHRLEREKYTKSAETFMDIYISVVIAAPMILMLLMMMMKISGIGMALSTGMITLVMVLGVTVINILFLTFLQLKQPNG